MIGTACRCCAEVEDKDGVEGCREIWGVGLSLCLAVACWHIEGDGVYEELVV